MKTVNYWAVGALLFGTAVFSSLAGAANITYEDVTNRPILFEDVGVDWGDGTILYYDVAVTWDSSFYDIFGSDTTAYATDSRLIAWDDSARAVTASNALSAALVNDGFTVTSGASSYLDVVYSPATSGQGIYLHAGPTYIGSVLANPSYYYGTVGYTQWAAVVPIPAAAWLFGSGLLGLVALGRRKARA